MTTTEPRPDTPTASQTERWLTDLEVEWTLVDPLDLARVDARASLRNQARDVPIDDETVERYADDMRGGDVFPPIIVREKNAGYVVLSGNHRWKATVAAKATIAAYVVRCDDETALRISYEDNRRHGRGLDLTERVRQAQHLVALGYTQAAAARVVGITQSRLSRATLAAEFETRCIAVGAAPGALAETVKSRLMNVRADPVFAETVRLVADAALPADDVYRIVSAVNAARSEAAALELVATERLNAGGRIERRKTGANVARSGETPRTKLLRVLTELQLIQPGPVASTTLPDQRRDLFGRLRKAAEHLAAIDKALR